MMPSLPPDRTRVQKRKCQEEEDAGFSLSEHDSREFDNAFRAHVVQSHGSVQALEQRWWNKRSA